MRISDSKLSFSIAWLAVATSSVVFIEPALTDILVLASLGLYFALGMRIPPGFGLPGILLGVYLLANLISAAMAPEPGDTLRFAFTRFYMAAICLLFVCLIYENPKKVFPNIWSAYVAACLIAVIGGLGGYIGLFGASEQLVQGGRVRSLFKDPNVYGPFLVPAAIYAMAKLETASKSQIFAFGALIIVCAAGIFLGFSRGAYINFAVSLTVFLAIRLATQRHPMLKRRMLRMTALILVGGFVALAGVASTDKVQKMMDVRLKVAQYYDTGEGGRITRQFEVATKVGVKPFGIGPGSSAKAYNFSKEPHNLYLHVLIEAGWVGGLAFIAFLFVTLWRGARYIRRSASPDGQYIAAYACVIGILTQSIFIDSTHWRHMFLLLGMIWGPLLYWENLVPRTVRYRRNTITPQNAGSA